MKWRAYPDEATRNHDSWPHKKGTEREGQVTSDAPGPGNRWVVDTDRKFHLVNVRNGRATEIDPACTGQ